MSDSGSDDDITGLKAEEKGSTESVRKLGQDGLGFCVELCALALQTDLKNDPTTKSILYKTIAYLLPNDLEVCRACALLVFFLERTVESYKTVFLLYKHPDQEYHADTSPVGNNVRFEVLQILKKGLFFDPEFWSLLNIETHCLKLMSDKATKAALCEITQEDKCVQNYCMKGHCHCHTDDTTRTISHVEKHTNTNDQKVESVKTLDNSALGETSSKPPGKKRGRKPGTKLVKDPDASPVRRSFRQIHMAKDHARQHKNRHQRFLAQQPENPNLKRRGRKPWWHLDELAAQAENSVPQQGRKPGRKPKKSDVLKEISVDAPVSEITLTLSYPDNEVNLSDIQTSLFVTETPHSTEHSTNKTRSASQEILKCSSVNSNSVIELGSVETLPCSKKNFIVTEEFFFQEQGLSMVRKFHTYSRVTEFEETTVDILPRDEEVKPHHNKSKNKRPLQTAEQPSEPHEIPEGATQISVYSSVEIDVTPIPAISSETSMPVKASIGPTEESTVEAKSNPDVLRPQTAETKCPDITFNPPEIINVAPPEVSNSISADTVCVPDSMPENMTGFYGNAPTVLPEVTRVPDDVVAALSKTEIDVFSEVVSKDTTMFEVPAGPLSPEMLENACTDGLVPDLISANVDSQRVLLKCSLCNKETKYQYILRHAMWHYRTDRKCMFCHKCYTHGRSPSIHFKLHIQELKESNRRFKENIELPEAPKQRVLKRVNCSVQNKFRHIKMRLNSSLNIADLHKKGHSSESKVRLRTRLAKNSELTSTLEEKEDKVCRKKRHLRKVLARAQSIDENKKMRLARARTKTIQAPDEDSSDTKGNSQVKSTTRRLNGVIRKSKFKSAQQEENNMDKKAQKSLTENSKLQTTEFFKAETNATSDNVNVSAELVNVELPGLDCKDVIGSELQGNAKAKITHRCHKEEVVAVKQTLVQIGPKEGTENQENKGKTSSAKEINTIGYKNGTQSKPKQHTTEFQGKRTGASTLVKCPVEICTFSAKSVLVLSHVLLHHHGDKKALVFFYHFGKEKCLYCGRKVCNTQHFFDHVICHKGELKHPCYHQGCKQRFQTRVELGEHMLGHHQLRAMCCFPGCSLHLDSILHLYKHEKTHYKFYENLEQTSLSKKVKQMVHKAPPSQDGLELATNSLTGHLVCDTAKDLANQDDDSKPLILSKGSVSYSSKNHNLINGHTDGDMEGEKDALPKTSHTAIKEQERPVSGKPTTKRFIRPPPSAYLDESYISMPKRWKEPQVGSKLLGAVSSGVTHANRQRCPRCFQSFNSEEEFQTHKDKCTSLFGFDSDDESAS